MNNRFFRLLSILVAGEVEFVLVGGVAANLLGSAKATFDIDIVYARNPDNFRRLAAALASSHPYLRGAPPGLPFRLDEQTLRNGLNFTLTTDLGDLDLLGSVPGIDDFEELRAGSDAIQLGDIGFRSANVESLIAMKNAAGRPKDLEALAELKSIREQRHRGDRAK